MMSRCSNERDTSYPNYGGRGIRVCERWHTFANFLADMGERPSGTSIDRFPDTNGNYEPGNCRWATDAEQNRNKRSTKLEAHEPAQITWLASLGHTGRSIAAFFGVSEQLVCDIRKGRRWRA